MRSLRRLASRAASSASSTRSSSRRAGTSRRMRSPVRTTASGPPAAASGRDVEHDGAEGGAAHPGVGDPHHVADPGPREVAGDRQVAGLGHAGRAAGAGVAEDEDVVRGDAGRRVVEAGGEVGGRVEDDGAALVPLERGRGGRGLDDGAARGEVAREHGDRARGRDRVVAAADGAVLPARRQAGEAVAEGPALDGGGARVDGVGDLGEEPRHPAGVVEVAHVAAAGGLEVDEHRDGAPERVDLGEVEPPSEAADDGGEVDDAVGRAAEGLQHRHGVADRPRGQEVRDGGAARLGEPDGGAAGRLGEADALGRGRGRGGRHRQGEAHRLGEAGHGAGGAHHRAGPDRGGQPVADLGDLGRRRSCRRGRRPTGGGSRCRRRGARRGGCRCPSGRWGGRSPGRRRWRRP